MTFQTLVSELRVDLVAHVPAHIVKAIPDDMMVDSYTRCPRCRASIFKDGIKLEIKSTAHFLELCSTARKGHICQKFFVKSKF